MCFGENFDRNYLTGGRVVSTINGSLTAFPNDLKKLVPTDSSNLHMSIVLLTLNKILLNIRLHMSDLVTGVYTYMDSVRIKYTLFVIVN